MSKYKIITYKNDILREKSQPVVNINSEIKKFIDDMYTVMYKYNGIGLAAIQIGVLKKIIIADLTRYEFENPFIKKINLALINPEIIETSEREEIDTEGCLSVPNKSIDVKRKFWVVVKGVTPDEKEIQMKLYDLSARVVQHEIDHLDGVLILDRDIRNRENTIL